MAEIHLLDGYAYDPSFFGEFNNSGIWIPKELHWQLWEQTDFI